MIREQMPLAEFQAAADAAAMVLSIRLRHVDIKVAKEDEDSRPG